MLESSDVPNPKTFVEPQNLPKDLFILILLLWGFFNPNGGGHVEILTFTPAQNAKNFPMSGA